MSRKNIRLKEKVERLVILDKTGKANEALDPKLDDELSLYLYKLMVQSRVLDERMINLQRTGKMGTYAPCRGQEATACGATPAMDKDDWIAPAYREVGSFIHRGWPMESLIFFWGGYEEGCVPAKGSNHLPFAVPIATQCLHAMGISWGMKVKGESDAVLCYIGDGGTSEGDFHEALNFAGVYKLPLVMFVVNNHWAISIPREMQTASPTIAQKAVAYGFDGIQVDGNDILGCYAAVNEAANKARSGGGPTLIEAVTYRMMFHTTADDPKKYRSEDEVKKWEKLDPITRYEKYLTTRGTLSRNVQEDVKAEAVKLVAEAVERYELHREVDPVECFDFTYEEMPPELAEQREDFIRVLDEAGVKRGPRGHYLLP